MSSLLYVNLVEEERIEKSYEDDERRSTQRYCSGRRARVQGRGHLNLRASEDEGYEKVLFTNVALTKEVKGTWIRGFVTPGEETNEINLRVPLMPR